MTQSSTGKEASADKILTGIEIDLNGKCRFNCSFCYLNSVKIHDNLNTNGLSLDEITGLIAQANELGAKRVILFNDPSRQHPDTKAIIQYIIGKNMQVKSFSSDLCCNPSGNKDSGNGAFSVIKCLKHKYSCFVSLEGAVYPCVGMPLSIGNIRKTPLGKILRDSEVIENLKNHESMIKGPCRKCEKFSNCYGCRARAFALTGDYLASDPQCPEN
ncbi:MAG: SPASM domain-containing protein, partial [Desulfobacula sp.]|nr:SPASM domain-containing protein [Desulfobacula sp.]